MRETKYVYKDVLLPCLNDIIDTERGQGTGKQNTFAKTESGNDRGPVGMCTLKCVRHCGLQEVLQGNPTTRTPQTGLWGPCHPLPRPQPPPPPLLHFSHL